MSSSAGLPTSIRLEHVTKRYRAGRSRTIIDLIASNLDRVRGRSQDVHSVTRGKIDATIWAMRDVSFEVPEGAGVGVIGRNGAGKTTLLKLISRVTWPTSGRVRVAGRVVSLIELGAGFHPELTGRENVYLGGGLFGLTRREIDRQFDEIVEFADVDEADRHADEALFLRSLRAARLQRRDSRESRHRAGGRGPRRRRRGIPAARARGVAPADRQRQDRAVHLARHVERRGGSAIRFCGWKKGACAPTAAPATSPSGT